MCVGGHKELVELMISHSHGEANEWNWCLQIACRYGYEDIVELMIENGAKNLDKGLIEVNETGRKDIAILLIEHGADINACSIYFLDTEIYYLIQKGILCPAEYSHTIRDFKDYQITLPTMLNKFLTRDLILEIQSF